MHIWKHMLLPFVSKSYQFLLCQAKDLYWGKRESKVDLKHPLPCSPVHIYSQLCYHPSPKVHNTKGRRASFLYPTGLLRNIFLQILESFWFHRFPHRLSKQSPASEITVSLWFSYLKISKVLKNLLSTEDYFVYVHVLISLLHTFKVSSFYIIQFLQSSQQNLNFPKCHPWPPSTITRITSTQFCFWWAAIMHYRAIAQEMKCHNQNWRNKNTVHYHELPFSLVFDSYSTRYQEQWLSWQQ